MFKMKKDGTVRFVKSVRRRDILIDLGYHEEEPPKIKPAEKKTASKKKA